MERFVAELSAATVGDPRDASTDVGPQARADLRDELHDQVNRSVDAGARLLMGGTKPDGPGAFYPVTALDNVAPGMAAFDEELFGPVAAIAAAESESHAIALANTTEFGLGGAVFTDRRRTGKGDRRRTLNAGCCFVNTMVASDPRLPFGGIGISGYGRELAEPGIRAFMNAKTVAVA